MSDIGLHETEARTSATRMVEKRLTHIESNDAKAGASQRAGILPSPASEVKHACSLWYVAQGLH